MTEHDPHTLTGVYALDALDIDERATFEEHLRGCSACRAEVAELTETASRLAAAAAVPVTPDVRDRVMEAVGQVRQASPFAALSDLDERRSRRWFLQPASIAAALLLVVSVGLGAIALDERQQARDAEQLAARVSALATDPDRVELNVPVSTGGYGTVVASGRSALFRTSNVATLPDDQVYQLWILRAEGAQSVGVLGRGGVLETLVEGMRPADALGLTIEPDGGSDRPAGRLVLRVDMA